VAYATPGNDGAIDVQPFPATGARYQLPRLTTNSGSHPFWSPDGTMLFNATGGPEFVVTSVRTQPTVAFGNPDRVPRPFASTSPTLPRRHDVMPDGRFIGLIEPGRAGTQQPEIRVVLNWTEELQQRVACQCALHATPEQWRDALEASLDLNPVYRRLLAMRLDELDVIEAHMRPLDGIRAAPPGASAGRRTIAAAGSRAVSPGAWGPATSSSFLDACRTGGATWRATSSTSSTGRTRMDCSR
jgi:hypothetical protein